MSKGRLAIGAALISAALAGGVLNRKNAEKEQERTVSTTPFSEEIKTQRTEVKKSAKKATDSTWQDLKETPPIEDEDVADSMLEVAMGSVRSGLKNYNEEYFQALESALKLPLFSKEREQALQKANEYSGSWVDKLGDNLHIKHHTPGKIDKDTLAKPEVDRDTFEVTLDDPSMGHPTINWIKLKGVQMENIARVSDLFVDYYEDYEQERHDLVVRLGIDGPENPADFHNPEMLDLIKNQRLEIEKALKPFCASMEFGPEWYSKPTE